MATTSHSTKFDDPNGPPSDAADRAPSSAPQHGTSRPPEPVPNPSRQILRCLPQDALAIARLLATASLERECPGSAKHRRLDDVVPKPWGFEFRFFDDPLVDAWLLHLIAGSRTSEHAHARKVTDLLCVRGRGVLTSGDGRRLALVPGVIVHIDQGAVHRTTATTELTIVELETPRDKLDVLRLKDENGRAGRAYEHRSYVDPRLPPLKTVVAGPARARLRPRCIHGALRFGVETARDVVAHPNGLLFAIALDPASILRRDLMISGPAGPLDTDANHPHLTIRNNHEEMTS